MTERVPELPPELMVERLAKGELSTSEAARVRAALGDDADARLQAIADDDAATLARLPADRVARVVRDRLAARDPARASLPGRWWIPLGAFAAASLMVWCAVRPGPSPDGELPIDDRGGGGALVDPSDGDVVRIKGDAMLTIDKIAGVGTERLADGASVQAGDRLQLQYRGGDRGHGAIVSIDGRGVATLHFPSSPAASTRLREGGLVALDHSYELDDAPAFERFFFVTTAIDTPIDVDMVMRAAKQLAARADAKSGALELPSSHEVVSLCLDKK